MYSIYSIHIWIHINVTKNGKIIARISRPASPHRISIVRIDSVWWPPVSASQPAYCTNLAPIQGGKNATKAIVKLLQISNRNKQRERASGGSGFNECGMLWPGIAEKKVKTSRMMDEMVAIDEMVEQMRSTLNVSRNAAVHRRSPSVELFCNDGVWSVTWDAIFLPPIIFVD